MSTDTILSGEIQPQIDSTERVRLHDNTKIWFDDGNNPQSSTEYCIQQLRSRMLADDRAEEAHSWKEADIVHLNTLPFRRRDVGIWRSSKPVVATQHGAYHWWRTHRELFTDQDWMHLVVRTIQRITSKSPNLIGMSTDHSRQLAVEHGGIPAETTRTIPLGKNENFADIDQTDTESPFVLVVVNNSNPRKNIPTILETIRLMPDVPFYLPGKMWPEYEQEKEGVLPPNAHILGYVPETELIELYNRASALYNPTLFEGFGLPLIEAMACGTAVVTTSRGSPKEVCGDAGVYVDDPWDAGEHRDLLKHLVRSDNYRKRVESRSKKRASMYSWESTSNKYIQAYNDILYE